jgi:hypothetical protein
MELNDLKEAWQNIEPDKDNFLSNKSKNTETMIKQKSQSIAQQIRNRFYLESLIGVVVILFVALTPTIHGEVKAAFIGAIGLLMAFFTPTLIRFYKLIDGLEIIDGSLKESLRRNVISFEEFLKYYIKINTIFAIITSIFVFGILRYYQLQGTMAVNLPNTWLNFIFLVSITCLAIIPITKWYINSMYGGYAKRLRTLSEEIESE